MRLQVTVRTALLCCVVGAAASVVGQSPSSTPAKPPAGDSGYPEQAYLSPSRYVNQYFGFSFDLPADVHLHPIAQPATRDGSIPLLDMAGPPPADAQILIAAIPTADGRASDAKLLLREALDQELYRGVEELHGLGKASLDNHQFFLFETRSGIEQHALFATNMGEYILRVVLAAHDDKVVKTLETSFEHVQFFAPAAVQQYVSADTKPYDGPSISSHRLALLESDPPARHIDPGKINGDFYENAMLGFSYRIPQGWVIEAKGAVLPAIERYRTKEDFGRPRMGRVEHALLDACGRTLFSTWAKRPDANGAVSYDDFGEVTIAAISMACFPNLKFPEDAKDREAFKTFIGEFALTHPIMEDMRDAKVFTQDGLTFLFLEGTVAFQVPNDELSRRLSLGLAVTQRRGYLLTWFFAAPHDDELRALTNERAIFDGEPAVAVAHSPQPGGGAAAEPAAAKPGAPDASKPASAPETTEKSAGANSSASGNAANAAPESGGGSTTAASDQTTTQSLSSRPSLLRPGETMETQQGKGPVIKRQ